MRTYTLPGSDIEVQVDYKISRSDGVMFEAAYIDGADLNADCLFIKRRMPSLINPLILDESVCSLASYFQDRLIDDENQIMGEEWICPEDESRMDRWDAMRDAAE